MPQTQRSRPVSSGTRNPGSRLPLQEREMRDKVVTCIICGEPFVVCAHDRRARKNSRHIYCDECGDEMSLYLLRELRE